MFAGAADGHSERHQGAGDASGHQTADNAPARPSGPPAPVSLTRKGERYAAAHDRGETIVLTLDRRDRLTLATTIERLLALLDDLDGDADMEPNLGWSETAGKGFTAGQNADDRESNLADSPTDREWDDSDSELGADAEPFLGWSERCSLGADEWQNNKQWVRGVDPTGDYVQDIADRQFAR